jgi:hypothetical protein
MEHNEHQAQSKQDLAGYWIHLKPFWELKHGEEHTRESDTTLELYINKRWNKDQQDN